MRVASKLLELAAALAPDTESRLPLVPDLARSLGETGQLRRADEFLRDVEDDSGDPPSRFAFLEAASLRDYTEANEESFRNLKEAPGRASNDAPDVRARAAIVQAEVRWTEGNYGDMGEFLEQARASAEAIDEPEGRRSLLNSIFGWEARALLLGPRRVEEGRARCDSILYEARATGSHALEAAVLAVSAGLHAMLGDFAEARRRYKESRRIGEVFGLASWIAALPLYSGPVELLAGDAGAAARQLRRGHQALKRMGDRSRAATVTAFLAHALYEQGDAKAEDVARISERLAAEDDAYTQVVWRGALAKVLARKGEVAEAARLAQEAVDRSSGTDGLNLRADALLDQAVILAEDDPSRRDNAQAARALYEEKGNSQGALRADEIGRLTS
jgi:hypothetical protein